MTQVGVVEVVVAVTMVEPGAVADWSAGEKPAIKASTSTSCQLRRLVRTLAIAIAIAKNTICSGNLFVRPKYMQS